MKRLLSILLVGCLLLAACPVCAHAAATEPSTATPPAIPTEGDVWDGSITAPTKLVQKDGVYYYEITKCAELAYVAQTGGEWLERNYLLANNLILNDVVLEWDEEGNLLNDPATLHAWTPIGGAESGFSGIFDGDGYTVSGMYVNLKNRYAGLFGNCSGTIETVVIVNSFVTGIYGYAGGVCGNSIQIHECVFSGKVSGTWAYVGGICGKGYCTDCTNFGETTGGDYVGGICGYNPYFNSCTNCFNYGTVTSVGNYVGGISGFSNAKGCANYGKISGAGAGGICGSNGHGNIRECLNFGIISGNDDYTGGICAMSNSDVDDCANFGKVVGTGIVGGVCGIVDRISNCYNTGTITGESNVGGIAGKVEDNGSLTNCYNIGNVLCATDGNNAGAILGSDGPIWGKGTVSGCYYLKTDAINTNLYGCGGVTSAEMEPEGFSAGNEAALQTQSTYEGWDFGETWRISPQYNDGYPYLAWERADDAPPLEGLVLDHPSLTLAKGDSTFLSVSPVPSDAEAVPLTWTSSTPSVATVNEHGRVTGVSVGTATITVSGGGFSASCEVTVTARAEDEYRIGALSLRDKDGAALTAIPAGDFWVTIPVTKLTEGGNSLILLAAYTANGQYRGMLYVSVEGLPAGASVSLSLPVDNASGEIALLKVFPVASFENLVLVGSAVCFPGE